MYIPLRILLLPLLGGTVASPLDADAQAAAPKSPGVLLHGYLDASAVPMVNEEMKNSGIMATHGSEWGICHARQRLSWRGDGPPHGNFTRLIGPSSEQKRAMTLNNMMAMEEFHLRSPQLFCPVLKAGISSVRLDDEVLTVVEYPTGETCNQYHAEATRMLGLDAGFRAFFPLSPAIAFEGALRTSFNEVESCASQEFECAA